MTLPAIGFRRWLVLISLALGWAGSLPAQSVLCVEHKGKVYAVHKVHRDWVTIMVDNKPVEIVAKRCGLQSVEEFMPVFISVNNIEVKTSYLTTNTGGELNNDFHFRAKFTSPYVLRDVFLVLELESELAGRRIFYQEVGELSPDDTRPVWVRVPMREKFGEGKYQLHLFAGGREVFHSQQPWQFREAQLDKMVFKRIAGVQQAGPEPFVGPVPEYPAALRKSGVKGEAVVQVRVSSRGVVLDPAVMSATDPAFGEAALAAVRLWRFLPQVKEGRAVETKVNMPFTFESPKTDGKKG
ncbi:MAG: energy transducer TonB [Opitutae bacterium]|nr:energy transducer TonB [Opitutae bacterium]